MNEDAAGNPEGTMRSLAVDLPTGLIGNPLAVPRCRMADFEGVSPRCPGSTQVGIVHADLVGTGATVLPLYNLMPPVGFSAAFGFSAAGATGIELVSLRSAGSDVGVEVSLPTLPGQAIKSITETIWGVPADPAHDPERTCIDAASGNLIEGCSAEVAPTPLLTMPTSCAGPVQTTITVTSAEEPGSSQSRSVLSRDDEGKPSGLTGCGGLGFDPGVSARPDNNAADSPSGLHLGLRLPLNEDATQPATAMLRDAVVRLPEGIAINPSAADGLLSCADPAACPDASKIGTARIETPLLEAPLGGDVYLAEQGDNPFASLLALYVVVRDPLRGVNLELAARAEADPDSGQLTVALERLPQLPFESLDLDFFAGPRAIFTTPPTCGEYRTTANLTPWTAPDGASPMPSDSFAVAAVPGGGACFASEAEAPNAPAFDAGTLAPLAGTSSPLAFRLERGNGSQRFRGLKVTLPPGVTARVAGIPECAERSLEQARPSCPAASEVGSARVGVGSGAPFYIAGHAYLAGPYKGAPLSLAIIVPALSGPFDLGTVVVRTALRIDPKTAAVTADADPLPTIVRGIPLDVRSIAVTIGRRDFIRNPTSCDPMTVRAASTSPARQTANLSQRFQVGGCRALGFQPKVAMWLLGSTARGAHPGLRATLLARSGDANLRRVQVALPGTGLLDSRHIRAVCTREQFAAGACPSASALGRVRAWTPLLDRPIEGRVFLRESDGRLPDLAVALRGEVDLELNGRIDSSRGRLRVVFPNLPDVPFSKVELTMPGGKRGLLANTGGLCAGSPRVSAAFAGQNGKRHNLHPAVKTDCGMSHAL